jgi:orotate phosphoribosyltransferase
MSSDQKLSPSTPIDGLAVRDGHFLLESGLHTATWIDLDTLFLDPRILAPHISALAALVSTYQISAVCGPLVGGAFVAQSIALELDVRFYFAERVRSNPRDGLFQAEYRLPNSQRERAAVERFAVIDDVIGAGSAVRATVRELNGLGATTVVVGALITLGSKAAGHLSPLGIPVVALSSKETAMWIPENCPGCRAGLPLQSVS